MRCSRKSSQVGRPPSILVFCGFLGDVLEARVLDLSLIFLDLLGLFLDFFQFVWSSLFILGCSCSFLDVFRMFKGLGFRVLGLGLGFRVTGTVCMSLFIIPIKSQWCEIEADPVVRASCQQWHGMEKTAVAS